MERQKLFFFPIGVYPENEKLYSKAESLAKELSLPLCLNKETAENLKFLLLVKEEYLALQDLGQQKQNPIWIDFEDKSLNYRRQFGGGSKQLIARAVGLPSSSLKIFDATAGLAKESFLLASLGCNVFAVERSPILGKLVEDGLLRAAQNQEINKILVQHFQYKIGNSIEVLSQLEKAEYPDVVYLDPMYPERKKSALVKKEMIVLRQLVGNDEDAQELFQVAIKVAQRRVVVKRPNYSKPLFSKPDLHYKGKNTRFDIYLSKK